MYIQGRIKNNISVFVYSIIVCYCFYLLFVLSVIYHYFLYADLVFSGCHTLYRVKCF